MSIFEPMSRRLRRHVPEPQRHDVSHVHVIDAELNQCHAEAVAMLRRPYDWSKDDDDLLIVAEPRACVVCKHGTSGRYLTDDALIPLCPRCHHGAPTETDIANVIAAAERFVGGEA